MSEPAVVSNARSMSGADAAFAPPAAGRNTYAGTLARGRYTSEPTRPATASTRSARGRNREVINFNKAN